MNLSIWRSNSIAWSKPRGARSRRPEPGKRRFDSRSAAKNAAIRISGRVFRCWETHDKSERESRYSTARVSKRLTDQSAACLRARYCTGVPMLRVDLNFDLRQLRNRGKQKSQRGAKKARTFLPSSSLFVFFASPFVCNGQCDL